MAGLAVTPRIATHADVPDLVEMGARFHAMSPHAWAGEYDRAAVARTVAFLIDHPDGLVVRNDAGVLGGLIAPIFFAPAERMMEESFWWAEARGQEMRKFFEGEARRMGASHVLFSVLENERIAAIDRVMRRDGYVPVERRYMKEIG